MRHMSKLTIVTVRHLPQSGMLCCVEGCGNPGTYALMAGKRRLALFCAWHAAMAMAQFKQTLLKEED